MKFRFPFYRIRTAFAAWKNSDPKQAGRLGTVVRFFAVMLILTLTARGIAGASMPKVTLGQASAGSITQSSTASGTISVQGGTPLTVPEGLLVAQVTATTGQTLSKGDVCLHVPKGHIYGLLGRNGAGKTSIMKLILQLMPATSGETLLFGEPVKRRERSVFQRIGAIIETPGFYPNLTGTENLEIFAKLRGTIRPDAVEHALQVVGLPYKDKKLFGEYSLGMKQRLGIANAIMHDPELLILDEPTNGLDPIGIAEVRAFIRSLSEKEGKTILVSSHILSEISMLADDIGILDHGVLLEEETMEELKKKNQKYILLQVSDTAATARILEQQMALQVGEYSIQDTTSVKIFKTTIDREALVRELTLQGVGLSGLAEKDDTLEDYFKKITGGEGIA